MGVPVTLTAFLDAPFFNETGDWQPVATFNDLAGNSYEFQFRSDISETGETPLPGAIWLFGTALAAAAGVSKWRRKSINRHLLSQSR